MKISLKSKSHVFRQVLWPFSDREIESCEVTEDILRTLAEFTADKIYEFFNNCGNPEEVIFHGGGINNNFLMNLIEEKLKVQIKTSDFKIPAKFVESAAFAYLAFLREGKVFSAKL
mgnify:CR=1 FL=1